MTKKFIVIDDSSGLTNFFVHELPDGYLNIDYFELMEFANRQDPIEHHSFLDGPDSFVFERHLQRCFKSYDLLLDTKRFQLDYPNNIGDFHISKEFWIDKRQIDLCSSITYYHSIKDEMIRMYYDYDAEYYYVFSQSVTSNKRSDFIVYTEEDAKERLMELLKKRKLKSLV